jgi:hypothetical protein
MLRAALSCLARGGVIAAACAVTMACEDSRPASVPRTPHEREALVTRWNALSARVEADNAPRVHAHLAPERDATLNADVVRASERLHDAHRVLEHTLVALPEQALTEMLDGVRSALDDADAAVNEADAIRASTEPLDAGGSPRVDP